MIKQFKEMKEKVSTAVGTYKSMSEDKKYLDKICDALYTLPNDVDYSGVQEHIAKKIDEYERKYNVKYSHPFVLPANIEE